MRAPASEERNFAGGRDVEDGAAGAILGLAGDERFDERFATAVIGPERGARRSGRLGDATINLAARSRLLIEQNRGQAEGGGRCRRGHAGWAGADDREIAGIGKSLVDHRPISRRPFWVSTTMPSRTRVMQPCRLPMPSTTARQSKQTPIMQ